MEYTYLHIYIYIYIFIYAYIFLGRGIINRVPASKVRKWAEIAKGKGVGLGVL